AMTSKADQVMARLREANPVRAAKAAKSRATNKKAAGPAGKTLLKTTLVREASRANNRRTRGVTSNPSRMMPVAQTAGKVKRKDSPETKKPVNKVAAAARIRVNLGTRPCRTTPSHKSLRSSAGWELF